MEDGFDVVAVGVGDEPGVAAGMVFARAGLTVVEAAGVERSLVVFMVKNLRQAPVGRYVAKVPDLHEPRGHVAVTRSLCLDARSDGVKQQSVGAFTLVVACAVVASVSAARAQRLEIVGEARFADELGPLPPEFGVSVALYGDGIERS